MMLLSFSCSEEYENNADIIDRAFDISDQNPALALIMLDSVSEYQTLTKSQQMDYIVALVQAKNKLDMDVSKDTLVFKAQEYFVETQNTKMQILANICASVVYEQNNEPELAIQSLLTSIDLAENTDDSFSLAKVYNNIGYLYFKQDVMDSAIVNYQKALTYYDNAKNEEKLKMQTLEYLGRSYDAVQYFDKSYDCLTKGYDLSQKLNDKANQFKFLHLLGSMNRDLGKYSQSKDFYQKALENASPKDSLRIYLSYAKLYNLQNRPAEAQKYIRTVENRLSEIQDSYILKSIYASLSEYYKLLGDDSNMFKYRNLQREALFSIKKGNKALRLLNAQEEFVLTSSHGMRAALVRQNVFLVIFIVLCGILGLRILATLKHINKKREEEDLKDLEKLRVDLEKIRALSDDYCRSLNKIFLFSSGEDIDPSKKDKDKPSQE